MVCYGGQAWFGIDDLAERVDGHFLRKKRYEQAFYKNPCD